MKILIINKKIIYISLIAFLVALMLLFIMLYRNQMILPTFNEREDVYYKGNIDTNVIAFACNVDWGEEYIEDMLNIFRSENIHITFFVTGKWAEKNQEILVKIYNEGHEIGNHGYYHKNYGKLSYEENKLQILKAHNIIKGIIGENPKFFAPPAGDYSKNTIKASKELDYRLVMWTIDTIDWRKDSLKDIIIKRVTSKLQNSAIVLMHPKNETVKALPEMIRKIKDSGYKIGKVSDIIK